MFPNTTAYHARRVHQAVAEGVGVVSAQSVDGPVSGAQIGGVRTPEVQRIKRLRRIRHGEFARPFKFIIFK